MFTEKIGRYEVLDVLGRGGMASVYKAKDPRFDREVAIKVLPPEFLHDPSFKTRFEREAKTIAKLEHHAIVPVYDFGEQADQPYLVMRYMPGGSLKEKIEKGPLSLEETNKILSRIADALEDASSKGVVHRDLKPANILFDQYDDAYLADFGIAKMPEAFATITGSSIVGTPSYMSPEQAQGEGDVDHTSDIYALGVILYEMLTGSQPFQATTPMGVAMKHVMEPIPDIREVLEDIPTDISKIIKKAMAKEKTERYQNAGEFAKALNDVVLSQTIQLKDQPATFEDASFIEKEIPPEDLKPSFFQRNRLLVGCGGISLILMCAALLYFLASCTQLLSNIEDLPTDTPQAALIRQNTEIVQVDATEPVHSPGQVLPTKTLKPDQPNPNPELPPIENWDTFTDDFSNPESGWYTYADNEGRMDYNDGKFEIHVDVTETIFWSTPYFLFEDVILTVQAEVIQSSGDGDFGLICRYQDENNFYGMEISEDGYACIWKFLNGEYFELTDWVYYDFLLDLEGPIQMKASCIGDNLSLRVMDKMLLQAVDSSFSEGDVGIAAGTYSNPGNFVIFDDFSITVPPEDTDE